MKYLILLLLAGVASAAPIPVNVVPSNINVTIMASRGGGADTCRAPCAVFFDAVGTTSPQTSKPFHAIEYRWNFGDTAAPSATYTNGSGAGVNLKNSLTGAGVAAHVYETAGTYSACLVTYDGTNTSPSVCRSVTVSAWPDDTNTVCIGNSLPTAGAGGCPSGAAVLASSDFDAALASCYGTNKRCLFKRGDTFALGTATNLSTNSGWVIGDYGSGTIPRVDVGAGLNALVLNAAASDGKIVNLEFVGAGAAESASRCLEISGSPANILMFGVTCRDLGRGIVVESGQVATGLFVVSSTIKDYYATSGGNAFFGFAAKSAFLDNVIGPSYGEHGIRLQPGQRVAISNNTMTTPASTKGALVIRANSHLSPPADTQYVSVADNKMDAGTAGTYVMTTRPVNDSSVSIIKDVVTERNWMIGGAATSAMYSISASNVTVRNNLFDMTSMLQHTGITIDTGSGEWATPAPQPYSDGNEVYNNTFYGSGTGNDFIAVKVSGKCFSCTIGPNRPVTNSVIKNNLAYAPNDSSHKLFSMTDDDSNLTSGSTTGASGTNGNSSDAQVLSTVPGFTIPPVATSDWKPTSGYAVGGGASVPVWSDFFLVTQPSPRDIGAVIH